MNKKLLISLVSTLATAVSFANFNITPDLQCDVLKPSYAPCTEQATQQASENATQVFADDFEDFDYSNMCPTGWTLIDNGGDVESPIQVVDLNDKTQGAYMAMFGSYCLASMPDAALARNSWAITPAITLEANVTYNFGIFVLQPQTSYITDEWQLTIGNAATEEAQTTVIIDKSGTNASLNPEWELVTGTFTPETSGTYYVGINHCTQSVSGNIMLWDYLTISSGELQFPPKGDIYSTNGLWSISPFLSELPCMYTYADEKINYGYHAEYCKEVEWDFDKYATASDITANTPIVTYSFPQDSIYNDVYLSMTNGDLEGYAMRSFNVKNIKGNTQYSDFVNNLCPEEDVVLYLMDANDSYTSLCSMCDEYSKIAEYYPLPNDMRSVVSGLYIIYPRYKLSLVNRKEEITIKIVAPDENGLPGNTIHSETQPLIDIFGTTGVETWSFLPYQFNKPIDVSGPFFVVLEFPELTYGKQNHLMIGTSERRLHDYCTLYYYNDNNNPIKENGWYKASDYYEDTNISAAIYALISFNTTTSGVEAIQTSNMKIAVNGSQLTIFNTQADDEIVIADLSGRIVLKERANAIKTIIDSNLNNGIYIVTIDGKTSKIVI